MVKITIELPDDLAEAIKTIAKVLPNMVVQEKEESDAPKPEHRPAPEPEPPDQGVSLEEVRAKLAGLNDRQKVREWIQEMGARKLSEVPKEKLPELLKKAEKAG